MKQILLACLFILSMLQTTLSQQNQTITVNTLQQKTEELYRNIYKYPEFINGQVVYTDNAISEARFNYHRLFDQILFIGSKGDTLKMSHPETFKMVIAGTDTFYFHQKGYMQQVTHYPSVNLCVKETIKYIGKEKKGAYGTYSTLYAASSNSTFTADDQITRSLELDENLLFKKDSQFFVSDRFNNFHPATKKGLYSFFSKHENELKAFIDNNSTDFKKQEDIAKLLKYMNSL